MKNNSVIKPIMALVSVALFLSFCFDLGINTIRTSSYAFLIICPVILILTFRKELPRTGVFYTMIAGMFLKLTYVMYTPVWCRQHDFIDFGAGEGHAAYMEYILSHKALPDFDPRSVWAFFQPPLHHMISAAWMWLNIRLGIAEDHMHKNAQILPFCYMCALMIFVYLICRELNMRKGGTLITMLIVSFHPIYILMSGSLNNDALCVMLSVISVYVAILWYMYPTTGKIILLALSVGLSMFAKLSVFLTAIGIGCMMLYKIITDTNKLKDKPKTISYLLELIPFSVIVFPLGLWWSIRNKMLFDMPIGYIPDVGEKVDKVNIAARLFDVRTSSPFLYMKSNGFSYDEYNLILATIKSSLFGEGDFARMPVVITITGWVLFVFAIAIIIIQIAGCVSDLTSKEAGPDTGVKILLGVTAAANIIGYIAFAISGANLSAMDFRYAASAVSVLAVFAGLWYDRLGAMSRKKTGICIMSVSAAFAVSSLLFYILVGVFTP